MKLKTVTVWLFIEMFVDLALGCITGSITPRTKEGTVRLCLAGQAMPKAMVFHLTWRSHPPLSQAIDGAVTMQSSPPGGRQQIDEGQTAKGNDRRERLEPAAGRGAQEVAVCLGPPQPFRVALSASCASLRGFPLASADSLMFPW